jgi:hypothetical protein
MRRIADGSSVIPENGPVTYSLPVPDRLLDVKEAAAVLNVPESWIYQHCGRALERSFRTSN